MTALQYILVAAPSLVGCIASGVSYVNARDWRERAENLWTLLDNIDTLDDSSREDDARFRTEARKWINGRHEYLQSYDGHTLKRP